MATKLAPRRMSGTGGMAQARFVSLKVHKRPIIDVLRIADYMAAKTIERIRELASKGRGYEGTLYHLKDNTVERYESSGIDVAGTKSTLSRTGALMAGLRYTLQALSFTRGPGGKVKRGAVVRIKIMGPEGDNRKIGFVGARRPFLGLSASDFRRLAKAGASATPIRSDNEIIGTIKRG